MGLLAPYNVEGKWSSAGAGDQGHTRDGNLATEAPTFGTIVYWDTSGRSAEWNASGPHRYRVH